MAKVYPNAISSSSALVSSSSNSPTTSSSSSMDGGGGGGVFTVWKKSLLFNCDGFTVLDGKGNLAFRVDNYGSAAREVLLMDASGRPLRTIRRNKRLMSTSVNWLMYEGEEEEKSTTSPILSARKHASLLLVSNSCLARVVSTSSSSSRRLVVYQIEGCYRKRCCAIYDSNRKRVAEIRRKEAAVVGAAFGLDVFRLVIVEPHLIDSALAMSLVILLDQMFP